MSEITIREVTRENWQEALGLETLPEQLHFVAGSTPIAAIALAKAYIRPGGWNWTPYAIYAGAEMVGFAELACTPDSVDNYWIFHFFIDRRFQGRGYGKEALQALIALIREQHPRCRMLQLGVHPENERARRLYMGAGFQPTGTERWGEPVYQLALE